MAGQRKSHALPVAAARAQVELFVNAGRFQSVAIADREWIIAAEAYARFGKGRHPAALNMGDCFAYACARSHGAKLL